jgi:hypothetical protein
VSEDRSRRASLAAVKLGALVREHLGQAPNSTPGAFAGGAAIVHDGAAWVLADERPERALGPALAWARANEVTAVNLLADSATGLLARRAAEFAEPPAVWRVVGRELARADASPLPEPVALDPRMTWFVDTIEAAGATPIVEHGVLAGEVFGLEVCRVVRDPDATGGVRLAVGIGVHDRDAFQLVHGDVPVGAALAAVVEKVAAARQPGAPTHALNRMAQERALRAALIENPGRVGAATLAAAAPPVPRANLKDATPCVTAGTGLDGQPVVVVCSVGIDLDLVPFAADARLATHPGARLVLAVPERDAHPVTRALAARLIQPATLTTV